MQFHNIPLQMFVKNDRDNPHLQRNDPVINVFSGLHTVVFDQSDVTTLGLDRHREYF